MKEALFIGEANPYGADPAFALYPLPVRSAGGRLCSVILGLRRGEYLSRFDRVNLCSGKWKIAEARSTADEISRTANGQTVVLLGAKVCAAFGLDFNPFTVIDPAGFFCRTVILPHPSGLNRMWSRPGAVEDARRVLTEAGIVLAGAEGLR